MPQANSQQVIDFDDPDMAANNSLFRVLSKSTHRHPAELGDIFVGLAVSLSPAKPGEPGRDLEWTIALHDGMGVIGSQTYHRTVHVEGRDETELRTEVAEGGNAIITELARVAKQRCLKVCLVAIAEPIPQELKQKTTFTSDLWLRLDSIPFVISLKTAMFEKLPPPDTATSASLVIAAAMPYLHPATHTATVATVDEKDHHVLVDCNEQVKLIGMQQYQESTSPELWRRFKALAEHMRINKISVSFFSATPQGGGVALMRHALLRLWRLAGVSTYWYVPEGHPHVFDITKRKIHNVLQGVAPPDVELSDKDKEYFEIWSEQNFASFWGDSAIKDRIIVIDDPQVAPLIPLIRSRIPHAKIIFRSHIQIQSNLTDNTLKSQHRVWNYLHGFIKDVDLFLAHPVRFFVPKVTKDKLPVLYMPPSTDPLDGLNKPFGSASVTYYRSLFNMLSRQQSHVHIDWSRGYVCQIARFDPSKGIDDLLAAYLSFRKQLAASPNPPKDGGPQLIIMGHGSVDDPDGTLIFEQCHDTLATDEYKLIRDDCAIVRAPPSDGLLGAILQGAWVATQLSTREGFEVKVTEAVNKRVPIIASRAGGIPLQVKDGENGWLVDVGDREAVATILLDVYTGKRSISRKVTGAAAKNNTETDPNAVAEAFVHNLGEPVPRVHDEANASSEDFWTVGNAVKWMLLFSLLDGRAPSGDDKALLESMGIGRPFPSKGGEENVWKMAMQEDLLEGEGVIL